MRRFIGTLERVRRGRAGQDCQGDVHAQTADAARYTAATFDKWLRRTIETQPYTVAIVARLGSAGCSAECTGRSDRLAMAGRPALGATCVREGAATA